MSGRVDLPVDITNFSYSFERSALGAVSRKLHLRSSDFLGQSLTQISLYKIDALSVKEVMKIKDMIPQHEFR